MSYDKLLADTEAKYGLPKGLLHAQMQAESNGNPQAKSPKGALGLMQFMPDTAKEYGVDPMIPEQAIDGAGRYMRDLVKQTGNLRNAVAAYNWGIGNLQRKGIDNAPEETHNYIRNVSKGMKIIAKTGLNSMSANANAGEDIDALWNSASPTKALKVEKYENIDELWNQAKPDKQQEKGFFDESPLRKILNPQNMKDLSAGGVRGAGSIGATIVAPYDMAKDAINGKGLSLESNRQRRKDMDDALRIMGADTDSGLYKTGKIVAEIAGTAGAGSAVGNVVGKVAPELGNAIASGGFSLGKAPAVNVGEKLINAATRVGGGAINGAVTSGMVDPETADTGAAIGAAFPVAAKIVGETGNAINGAVRPFYEKGRNAILGERLVEQAGSNPSQVIQNLKNAKGNTIGFNPTVGQAAGSDELATMERVMRGANPGAFQDTMEGQTKALADAIRSNGGDDIQRQALVDARAQASEPFFNAANNQPVKITPEIEALMQRPSMKQATSRAESIALESGVPFDANNMIGADAQRIKMGLDDLVNTGSQTGLGANELNAIRNTKGSYLTELEKQIPDYLEGNRVYKSGSAPINQMDLGNAITDKLIPATQRDMDVPISLNYENFARAVRDKR